VIPILDSSSDQFIMPNLLLHHCCEIDGPHN